MSTVYRFRIHLCQKYISFLPFLHLSLWITVRLTRYVDESVLLRLCRQETFEVNIYPKHVNLLTATHSESQTVEAIFGCSVWFPFEVKNFFISKIKGVLLSLIYLLGIYVIGCSLCGDKEINYECMCIYTHTYIHFYMFI